ncbi:MAG: hypothetical protein AAF564_11245 [Bacteroidota bacterium]
MPAPFASTRERFIVQALQAIAAAKALNCTLHADGWIIELSRPLARTLVYGYTFDLNSASATAVANDKAGMSALLDTKGIPHVPHHLVLSPTVLTAAPDACADLRNEQLHRMASAVTYPLVCKANQGSGGNLVFRVDSMPELDKAADIIFTTQRALALSPYIDIQQEYRLVMLRGEVLLAYEKIRPTTRRKDPRHHWQHNLGRGSIPKLIPPETIKILAPLAAAAMHAGNLQVGAVDIINSAAGYQVLEINAGIMLEHFARLHEDGRKRASAIYETLVEACFDAR